MLEMKDLINKFKNILTKSRDVTSFGIASLLSNAIGALFWLYMASILDAESYGEVSYLISIAVVFSTISLAGMANVIIVYGAKNVKIQSTVFLIGLITSGITATIIFFFIAKDVTISLYIIGFVMYTLVTAELIGKKLFSKYSKIMLIQKILFVVLSISLYYLIGIQGIVFGIALSFLVFSFIIYQSFKEMKINFEVFKGKYKFTINSFLLEIFHALHSQLDKIILAPLLGFALLGNYHLGVQFIGLLYLIPGVLLTYILPHDASEISTKLIKKITILISIVIAISSIVLTPILIPIIFPKFVESIEVIQIMSVSIVASAIAGTYVTKYLGSTNNKIVIIGSGITLAIQIPMIIILGKIYGLNGVAMSTLTHSFAYMIYFILVDKFQNKSGSTTGTQKNINN